MGLLSNFRHKFHNVFFTQVLYGTVASLAIFLTSWDHLDRMRDRLQSKLHNDMDTFDFVVVGGGMSGSVVANRLSQYYSVLLLEAGGEPHPFQAVPGLAFFMPNHAEVDWMHRSVPQKRAFGNSLKREASLSQGKGLGGSGNLNFLNYMRGSPMDFENWKNITGDESWGYNEMRKYFRLIEEYSKGNIEGGASPGAVKLDIPDYVGLSEEFITAGQELGYKHVDLNDNFVEGFDVNYYPVHKGVRQAPYLSYVKPARNRKSLTIMKFANVNKVLFRDDSKQAIGVEYERHGEVKVAKATKEVILSAGALSTPKVLMLSGVGPAQHLQDVGIPLRVNLPVGKNLQDHISTLVGPFFIKDSRSLLLGKEVDSNTFLDWGMNGKGPLTTSMYQASGLILSSFAKTREEDHNWPDIHLQLSSIGVHKTYAQDLAHAYNLQENLVAQYYNHAGGKHGFSISVANGRPVARGELLLSSRDPQDKLMINPRYLEDPYGLDVNIMKDGIKTALRLAENSTAFKKIGTRFTEKRLPGCEHVEFRSEAYWECYIRQFSISMQSFCGTAAMGEATSKFAVVDPELKVIGTKGLRVIDASVMPTVVVGGTQAATLAIGEKGADNILKYWRQFDVPENKNESNKVNDDGGNAVADSFTGFSFLGKVNRDAGENGGKINNLQTSRKHPKQKVKSSASSSTGAKVSTSRPALSGSTASTSSQSEKIDVDDAQKSADFEHAETRFSHNLNTIMEFLRNSRAINEEIDDHTYNDLVQNFGERIVELMRKNKTDIFFVPVAATTTTTTRPLAPSKIPKTTRKENSTNPHVQPINNFGVSTGKTPFGKIAGKESASPQKNGKQYQPHQFSTTPRPSTGQITTQARKLSTYFLDTNNGSPKSKLATTAIPKKLPQISTSAAPKFSSLISHGKPSIVVTTIPKGVSPSTAITTNLPPSSSPQTTISTTASAIVEDTTEWEEEDSEEGQTDEPITTTGNNLESVTFKPEQTTTKKPIKFVELILNPDLSINKTVEGANYSARQEKKDGRKLIEYRTEELRPFPQYPPYKIVPVPGQEFVPPRLVPPNLVQISPVLFQQQQPISQLTPPPPRNVQITQQASIQVPIPNFQQAQLIPPPIIPTIIDENLPIQTAKTVLYYTQVFPRDPNEIRNRQNAQHFIPSSSSSSSSSGIVKIPGSSSTSIHNDDPSQNIVQFFPSIH